MTVKKQATKKVSKKVGRPAGKKAAAKPVKKSGRPVAKKSAAKPVKKLAAKKVKKSAPRTPAASRQADPTSELVLRQLSVDYEASPDMPVKVQQLELASLTRLAGTVAKPLAKVGITGLSIETLGRFAKRLGVLETGWQKARASIPLATADRNRLAEAEALDSKLLAGGRWACRKDPDALTELGRIAEGSGLKDTIQDLKDLVTFWGAHAGELVNTDITAKDLARATELAGALEPAADKEGNNLDAASALALRNRCFWAADDLAKEIREGGRYAFRLQPKTAAKFSSRYRLAALRRSRRKDKDDPTPTPAV